MAVFGGIWRYLAVFGGIWRYLAVLGGIGRYWAVLGGIGRYWAVLGGIGRYWAVLGGIGRYWAVYAVPTVITRLREACTGSQGAVQWYLSLDVLYVCDVMIKINVRYVIINRFLRYMQ